VCNHSFISFFIPYQIEHFKIELFLYKKQTKVYDTVTGNCHWVILAYILGDHYRVLRVVENDWKKKKKRSQLDSIGRARPSLWAKYAMGNFVIKTLKYSLPVDLHNALHRTLFSERRRPQRAKFFDSSKSKIGYQAVQNRIGALFDTLNFDNYENSLTDNAIRILLKKHLGMLPGNFETQATTIGETQATTNGNVQATTNG